MFKFIFWSILFVLATVMAIPMFISQTKPRLILNMWNEEQLPRHFRTAKSPFKFQTKPIPTRLGLDRLKLSGSSQFSINGYKAILAAIPSSKVTFIDLRQESHGFVDGIGVSWYGDRDWANKGKTLPQIQEDEWNKLNKALEQKYVFMFVGKKYPLPFYVRDVFTEMEIVKESGMGYIRIPVTDHLKPSPEAVDDFINAINSLPNDTWIHIHCAAGEGRTTTFMTMYDIMQNAHHVKLEDIFKRQWLIGGLDLLSTDKNDWKLPYEIERIEFLKEFYRYCKEDPQFQISWSEWIKRSLDS